MVEQHAPVVEIATELEGLLRDASHPVARLLVVQEKVAQHTAHPGITHLVHALNDVGDVLMRFDLASVADPRAGFALAVRRRQATERFDSAFDDTLAKVHTVRREAGRIGLAAAARGSQLGPHIVQLRRELQNLHQYVVRAEALLGRLVARLAAPAPGHDTYAGAAALAHRANTVGELHDCGRHAIDMLRDCEEAFAALLVRLKHELGPTYVEWKRLLSPVAMRAFSPEPLPMELPEAREVHALLQRQVQVACETAAAFEAAQRRLEDAVAALGRCAKEAMATFGAGGR